MVDLLGAQNRNSSASDQVGSAPMEVKDFSPGFFELLLGQQGPLHARLHKRPKGLLVELGGTEAYGCWAVPYHELSVFKSEFLSIHCSGQFLKLSSDRDMHETARLLLDAKASFLGET